MSLRRPTGKWDLRDYGVEDQLGLESTPEEYVTKLVEIFREVKRVLRDDGTLWLNLGSSYAGSHGNRNDACTDDKWKRGGHVENNIKRPNSTVENYKPKDLIPIPWLVAMALQQDGWWLRSDIIWAKPNPMPSSVTDRPTTSHEYIFLLSKSQRYFYDAEAVKEKSIASHSHGKNATSIPNRNDQGSDLLRQWRDNNGRNKRSVWTISTKPFNAAHFATFPPDLIEPCILAGSSQHGACAECGSPYERQTKTEYKKHENWFGNKQDARHSRGKAGTSYNEPISTKTTGWKPTCKCSTTKRKPCVVLDPFGGAGTTAVVAKNLGRDYILIELNEAYIKDIAEPRIRQECAQLNLFHQTSRQAGKEPT